MNKGLEALETLKLLKDFVLKNNKNGLDRRFIIGICDILEKELKEKEELAQALSIAICENGDLLKYKQALESIKSKSVNVKNLIIYCFEYNDTYENYIDAFNYCDNYWDLGRELLTQEEFNLLKEILL